MEVELKVGLAYLSKRTLVLPELIEIRQGTNRSRSVGQARPATLTDLFELPPGAITSQEFNRRYPEVTPVGLPWRSDREGASSAYFVSSSLEDLPDGLSQKFANGRRHAWIDEPRLEEQLAVVSAHRMLGWYSHFFLLKQDEFVQLRDLIRQIIPKAHYSQYADEVVKSLGRFNALHVRRGDFFDWWVTVPPAEEILRNISGLVPRHEPLLICTDSSGDEAYFQPFFELFPDACFLDRLILEHPMWAARLNGLPFSDDGVLGLLTQLIAAQANVFAGTLFSTFTAHIHRQRLFERGERAFRLRVPTRFLAGRCASWTARSRPVARTCSPGTDCPTLSLRVSFPGSVNRPEALTGPFP